MEINFFYDYLRFKKHYGKLGKLKNSDQSSAWLLQDCHRIEKALTLPNPRRNFGRAVLERLIGNIHVHQNIAGKDKYYYFALSALELYKSYHLEQWGSLPDFYNELVSTIDKNDFIDLENKVDNRSFALLDHENVNFIDMCESRFSCRDYNLDKKVSSKLIEKAVRTSIKTPSVCNRQHWKIHIFEGDKLKELLALQNGNTGFGDKVPYLAVVTSNLNSFYAPIERYQQYVDGGMFSMSFIYSLHSLGVASCALNWSATVTADLKLHKLPYFEENESVVMFIAFGYPNDNASYALSTRKDLNEIINIH